MTAPPSLVRAATACVALLCLFGPMPAHALVQCVNSPALLQAALLMGELFNQPMDIRLVQGTYTMTSDINTDFANRATIEGGYTANCASRSPSAENTVINLQGHGLYLDQKLASPRALLSIDGVTFANINQTLFLRAGRPDHVSADEPGDLTLRRVRFTNIKDAAHLEATWGTLTLQNVLFDHVGTQSTCGLTLVADDGNLFINHSTFELPGGSDLCLADGGDASAVHIANSIVWSASGAAPTIIGPLHEDTDVRLVNTVFKGAFTLANQTIVNQIASAPAYVDAANGNYRLKTNPVTAAINSGTLVTPLGVPATDIAGQPRVVGYTPDRGAYESSVNDYDTLVVTNVNDNGLGSLRQAIIESNATPGDAKHITFDIRIGPSNVPLCPALIALSTPLPPIAGIASIDGYTQPGAIANSSTNAFNAKVCVLVKPATGTLATGFRVAAATPNASLSLRGIGLGGIAQPMLLLGGHDHVIAGNQFGGNIAGVALPGATFNAVSIGSAASGGVQVGGVFLADRNVIGGAAYAGVQIQDDVQSSPDKCQVVNNLIGLSPGGNNALPNHTGINADGAGCLFSRNRIAGNTSFNIWLNGGSHDNVVQQNVVGVTAQGFGIANTAIGIYVSGKDNIIGAQGNGDAVRANTVRYMIGGGIVVHGNHATGNSILANQVFDNGVTGDGMDIDLQGENGVAGPTPNDAGDADVGGNHLVNSPTPIGIEWLDNAPVNREAGLIVKVDVSAGTYRIDVYSSDKAAPNGRGHAQTHLLNVERVLQGGNDVFLLAVKVPTPTPTTVLSMTLTAPDGSTSEIGEAILVGGVLFSDDFENAPDAT